MKKNINKRILSFILAIILCISIAIPVFATEPINSIGSEILENDEQNFNNEYQNIYNKVHIYLDKEDYVEIDSIEELEEALAYLYEFREIYEFEDPRIWITVQFRSEFGETEQYQTYVEEKSQNISREESKKLKDVLYPYSKEYHNSIVKEGLDTLSFIDCDEVVFYDYSPFALLKVENVNVDEVKQMIEMENIVNISINFEIKAVNTVSWNNMLKEINAEEIVEDGLYTGRYINVGVLEAEGVCDVEHENLSDKTIILNNDSSTSVSDHATEVTSVIALMMPEAEYYVSSLDDSIGLDWFISEQCDIVNCSFAYINNYKSGNTYIKGVRAYQYGIDAVYDYQIYFHDIVVVASSGNVLSSNTHPAYNPDPDISSPALGFNVITVGGLERTWAWFQYHLEYAEGACYISDVPKVKPEVSALFTVNIPNIGEKSGTSYSAPQVTACLTGLMESYLGWLSPEDLKSLLICTANITNDYTNNVGAFYDKVGAGSVDCYKLIYTFEDYHTEWTRNTVAGDIIFEEYIELEAGQEIQIGLAWNMCLLESGGIYYLNDYDVRIYAVSDTSTPLATSILAQSNSELIRYTVESAGEYVIIVKQYGNMNASSEGDYVTLSYCLN